MENFNLPFQNYFKDLCKIPRGSSNEQAVSDYLVTFAKKHNLRYVQDKTLNVVIYKEASAGYETHKPVALQAHIDMVNEKTASSTFDFDKDELQLYMEDGFLKAKDTTLGADNGVGVSYMLAILADTSLKHPKLTCIFTVEEETTMLGAFELDASLIEAEQLINLDSEEDDTSTCASAGGTDVFVTRTLHYRTNPYKHHFTLSIDGLSGGHSGADIHKEKGNSLKLTARILYYLSRSYEICLSNFQGGSKVNAIPRSAVASFGCNESLEIVKEKITHLFADIKKEIEFTEPNVTFHLEETPSNDVIALSESNDLLKLLYLFPNGMRNRSLQLDGLTSASENVGILTMQEEVKISAALRGSLNSLVVNLALEIETLANILSFNFKEDNWYPAWDYLEHSPLRDTLEKVYFQLNHEKMHIVPIHAGLECGIFKNKKPSLDIITMGPNIYDVHSPNEKLDVASSVKTYHLLTNLLENL